MTETGDLTYRRTPSAARTAIRLHDHARAPHSLLGSVGTTTPVENIIIDLRPSGLFETTRQ
jgi:hypothetical protein